MVTRRQQQEQPTKLNFYLTFCTLIDSERSNIKIKIFYLHCDENLQIKQKGSVGVFCVRFYKIYFCCFCCYFL